MLQMNAERREQAEARWSWAAPRASSSSRVRPLMGRPLFWCMAARPTCDRQAQALVHVGPAALRAWRLPEHVPAADHSAGTAECGPRAVPQRCLLAGCSEQSVCPQGAHLVLEVLEGGHHFIHMRGALIQGQAGRKQGGLQAITCGCVAQLAIPSMWHAAVQPPPQLSCCWCPAAWRLLGSCPPACGCAL